MSFMENMQKTLDATNNVSYTENGAKGYRTTGSALLDLNFSVSSLRDANENDIIEKFHDAFEENKELAVKWLFFARDIRGGMGERRLFRVILRELALNLDSSNISKYLKLVALIPEYGRWDDLFVLFDTPLERDALQLIKEQLEEDNIFTACGGNISLLAKWLPSINTSSQETRKRARKIARFVGLKDKDYRKLLKSLREKLKVVETIISRNNWGDVEYERVPSKANLLYAKAFARHDAERRAEYLAEVDSGESHINSSDVYPYEIVYKIRQDPTQVQTYKAMWEALPDFVNGDSKTMVVMDGSGSMYSVLSGTTNARAIDVAMSLAIYFSERCTGEFKDKFITFSESPRITDLSRCTNIVNKIEYLGRFREIANTDIKAVFELILATAIKCNSTQDDLPDNILIVSDMEFDRCAEAEGNEVDDTLFDYISEIYGRYGYKVPRLVFWNLCSRTGTIPMKKNELGVCLVSGFSPTIASMVFSGKTDPYECLVEKLMSDRYVEVTIN